MCILSNLWSIDFTSTWTSAVFSENLSWSHFKGKCNGKVFWMVLLNYDWISVIWIIKINFFIHLKNKNPLFILCLHSIIDKCKVWFIPVHIINYLHLPVYVLQVITPVQLWMSLAQMRQKYLFILLVRPGLTYLVPVHVWFLYLHVNRIPGPGAIKLRWAHFWSHSQFSTIYSLSKFYGPGA